MKFEVRHLSLGAARTLCVALALPQLACAAPADPQGVATSTSARPHTADEVVAAARRALGWDHVPEGAGVRVTGAARFLGTDSTQTMLFDRGGRFVNTFDGSRGSRAAATERRPGCAIGGRRRASSRWATSSTPSSRTRSHPAHGLGWGTRWPSRWRPHRRTTRTPSSSPSRRPTGS